MSARDEWREAFAKWPASIPRRGIITTVLNEHIPFRGFMVKQDAVLLERSNPDSLGARFIILQYEAINALKYIDPIKTESLAELGFTGKLSQ